MSQPVPPVNPTRTVGQALKVLLTVGLAIAATGYFVGLRQSRTSSEQVATYGSPSDDRVTSGQAPKAVSYSERPISKLGPNREWKSDLANLRQPAPTPAPKESPVKEAIAEILQARETRRAFEGAPPIIPHPTPQMSVTACLACHGEGIVIADKRASKMSHPNYGNCTQCHVEVTHPDGKNAWQNSFLALRAKPAERAYPGAPPVVPHPSWMRNECQSCHGATGPAPLRTTHPERQSCLQCHALSDAIDFVPLAAASVSVESPALKLAPKVEPALAKPDPKKDKK